MALDMKNISPALKAEIEKYRKALEENPGSRMFAALADSLRKAGDVKASIAVAEDGVKRHPKYMSGLVILAQAYMADKQLEPAIELLEKVIRMNPENLVARKSIAEVYDRLGDHHKAHEAYTVLTMLDPTDLQAKQRLELLEATMPKSSKPLLEEKGDKTVEIDAPPPDDEEEPEESKTESGPSEDSATIEIPSVDNVMPPAPDEVNLKSLPDETKEREEEDHDDQEDTQPGFEPVAPPEEAAMPGPVDAVPPAQTGKSKSPPGAKPGKDAKKSGKSKLSEEDKLELFFSGADLGKVGIADSAHGFEVKQAGQALAEGQGQAGQEAAITASPLARVFWDQGFKEKALMVMAHEVLKAPNKAALVEQFKELSINEGHDPDELLGKAREENLSEREADAEPVKPEQEQQATQADAAPEPIPDKAPEPVPDEAPEPLPSVDDIPETAMPEPVAADPEPEPAPEPDPEPETEPAPAPEPRKNQTETRPEQSDGGKTAPDEDSQSLPQEGGIQVLKSYLQKIKKDKERQP